MPLSSGRRSPLQPVLQLSTLHHPTLSVSWGVPAHQRSTTGASTGTCSCTASLPAGTNQLPKPACTLSDQAQCRQSCRSPEIASSGTTQQSRTHRPELGSILWVLLDAGARGRCRAQQVISPRLFLVFWAGVALARAGSLLGECTQQAGAEQRCRLSHRAWVHTSGQPLALRISIECLRQTTCGSGRLDSFGTPLRFSGLFPQAF